MGEGVGCDLTLSCTAGQTIKEITFADWVSNFVLTMVDFCINNDEFCI